MITIEQLQDHIPSELVAMFNNAVGMPTNDSFSYDESSFFDMIDEDDMTDRCYVCVAMECEHTCCEVDLACTCFEAARRAYDNHEG